MQPLEMTAHLEAFERRGPGTDAERRAARWLAAELRAPGRRVSVEPFWCRPNWALAHAWHVALALAGSLLSVSHPTLGVILLAVALGSIAADALLGISPGRRLTPERASQNVLVTPDSAAHQQDRATLLVAANYDVPRNALVYRATLRRAAAVIGRTAGPCAVGWLGCLSLAVVWVLAVAAVRTTGHASSSVLGVIQLPPSIALVLALALLLEAAGARHGSSAGGNSTGVAVAAAIVGALHAAPPPSVDVLLVLTGAGEGNEIGLRRYLKAHERELGRAIVLGIAPCGAGRLRWWRSDGRLIPIGYSRRLRRLANEAADDHARSHRGRGGTPALPARSRLRPLPALAIGTLDARGLPTGTGMDAESLSHAVDFALRLVEAIDAELDATGTPAAGAPTPA
jgi:hypothetical protein